MHKCMSTKTENKPSSLTHASAYERKRIKLLNTYYTFI